jgi:hypothetical protein
MRTTIVAALLAFAIVAAGCDDSTPTGPTNDAAFSNFATSTPDAIRSQARDTCFLPPADAVPAPALTPSAVLMPSAVLTAPVPCRPDQRQNRFIRR